MTTVRSQTQTLPAGTTRRRLRTAANAAVTSGQFGLRRVVRRLARVLAALEVRGGAAGHASAARDGVRHDIHVRRPPYQRLRGHISARGHVS
eukprot:1180745-Prorocentrum_minimum.AAC.5